MLPRDLHKPLKSHHGRPKMVSVILDLLIKTLFVMFSFSRYSSFEFVANLIFNAVGGSGIMAAIFIEVNSGTRI